MQIMVQKTPIPAAVRGFAYQQIISVFHQFQSEIRCVAAVIKNEKDPVSGLKKACQIIICTASGHQIIVGNSNTQWQQAIKQALKKSRAKFIALNKQQPGFRVAY